MSINKLLVIAPHPDDEINLAGQLIFQFCKENKEVYVLYTTNGDAEPRVDNCRMEEAVKACSVLGVPERNVLFLGYANEWKDNKHIYNQEGEIESALGKRYTNGYKQYVPYVFQKTGQNNSFTSANFKRDLKRVIEDIRADLIISVDYDVHSDHRAASLTFDAVIGELLKEHKNYRPIIFKKYAYNGVWKGEKDYYSFQSTKCNQGFEYGGEVHQLESPNFLWEDRIKISTPCETRTRLLKKNILYKAACQHKHTTAWYEMQRVINSDVTYWWRPTQNLLYNAKVEVSSGESGYLNDFMMYDSADIMKREDSFGGVEYAWRPIDQEKKASISFDDKKEIKQINIYEDHQKGNHIKELIITIEDKQYAIEPKCDGSCTKIVLDDAIYTDNLQIQISKWIGNPGLSEIEIYSDEQVWNKEIFSYDKDCENKISTLTKIAQRFEKLLLMAEFAVRFKIRYEIDRIMSKSKGN